MERLAAFDVFHAHGGPYEVVGDRLVISIDIAKSPNTMSGEATYEYRLEFAGDRVRVIREVSDETRVTTLRRLEQTAPQMRSAPDRWVGRGSAPPCDAP